MAVIKRAFRAVRDAEHRSRKREQGAYVRAQGRASSRQPAYGEKRRGEPGFREMPVASRAGERTHKDVRAGKRFRDDCLRMLMPARDGFGDFCRNKSRPLAAASGTKAILRKSWILGSALRATPE